MSEQIHIVAGEALKALWGHTIAVGDQQLRIGPTGHLSVSQAVADRLLAQSGWVRCDEPAAKAVGEHSADGPPQADEATAQPTRRGKRRRSTR